MFSDPSPKHNDSDNNLLFKICQVLSGSGGAATSVEGGIADSAPETQNPIPVAGKAVTSASYAPAYADGDRAALAVDKTSGGLLTHGRKLNATDDFVSIAGDVAHDAVDAGFPIKVGGRANSASEPTAVVTGDRVNAFFDLFGRQVVKPSGVEGISILAAAARTVTTNSAVQTYGHVKGVTFLFDITSVAGAGTLTPRIEVQQSQSGLYYTFLTLPVISAAGQYVAQIYPGITENVGTYLYSKGLAVPRVWRLVMAVSSADSITYAVTGTLHI